MGVVVASETNRVPIVGSDSAEQLKTAALDDAWLHRRRVDGAAPGAPSLVDYFLVPMSSRKLVQPTAATPRAKLGYMRLNAHRTTNERQRRLALS
ncbi:hypothetical protein F4804DRAFT_335417 [Jackrogersella minutella]|nr:hypothetical protein F4804DRAFT_335417 [Jackrogersella minutella]